MSCSKKICTEQTGNCCNLESNTLTCYRDLQKTTITLTDLCNQSICNKGICNINADDRFKSIDSTTKDNYQIYTITVYL